METEVEVSEVSRVWRKPVPRGDGGENMNDRVSGSTRVKSSRQKIRTMSLVGGLLQKFGALIRRGTYVTSWIRVRWRKISWRGEGTEGQSPIEVPFDSSCLSFTTVDSEINYFLFFVSLLPSVIHVRYRQMLIPTVYLFGVHKWHVDLRGHDFRYIPFNFPHFLWTGLVSRFLERQIGFSVLILLLSDDLFWLTV